MARKFILSTFPHCLFWYKSMRILMMSSKPGLRIDSTLLENGRLNNTFKTTDRLSNLFCTFKMVKFNVLQLNQALMARFGIYSYRLTQPTNEFFSSISTYYILFFSILSIGSCAMSMYRHFTNLMTTLEAVVIIVAVSQGLGAFINLGYKMQEIKILHLELQSIVNNSEH